MAPHPIPEVASTWKRYMDFTVPTITSDKEEKWIAWITNVKYSFVFRTGSVIIGGARFWRAFLGHWTCLWTIHFFGSHIWCEGPFFHYYSAVQDIPWSNKFSTHGWSEFFYGLLMKKSNALRLLHFLYFWIFYIIIFIVLWHICSFGPDGTSDLSGNWLCCSYDVL